VLNRTGAPDARLGKIGDIQVRLVNGKPILFVKYANKWYGTELKQSLTKHTKKKEESIVQPNGSVKVNGALKVKGGTVDLTTRSRSGSKIVTSSDLTLQSGGAINLTSSTSSVSNDINLNTGGRDLTILNGEEKIIGFSNGGAIVPTLVLYAWNGNTDDYFQISSGGNNGETTISTVDAAAANANLTIDPDGDLSITPNTDVSINLASGGEFILQENGGTYTPSADTHVATKKYVDDNAGGTEYAYATYQSMNWRMSAVNTYYVGNQSLGTSVSASDFGIGELKYSIFNSIQAVTLTRARINFYVTSTEPYEFELWDITVPANGSSTASTATQIGSTLEVGGNLTASRYYAITSGALSYSLSAGHQVFLLARYTDGSGTKNVNASVTLEMTI